VLVAELLAGQDRAHPARIYERDIAEIEDDLAHGLRRTHTPSRRLKLWSGGEIQFAG
jgi:hypothetical protein